MRDVSPDSQEKVVSQLINGICEEKNVKQSDNLVLVAANNKEKIIHFTCKIFLPTTSMESLTSIVGELSRSLNPLSLC